MCVNLLLFFTLVLFWGCSFIAIRESLHTFPPFMAAGLRIFLGMILLWIYAKFKKRPNTIRGKMLFRMLFLGILLFFIPWACLFWGEQYVNPSIASIINSTVPIFILILSWAMLPDERPTLPSTIGVALGFLGMFCVFLPGLQFHGDQLQLKRGMLSIFLMSVSYAFGGVLMRRWSKGIDMVWALIFQALSGTICLAILSWATGETIQDTSHVVKSTIGIVYLSLCSTAIASLIYYHLIFQWGTLKAAAVTYLTPFVAIIVDILFLHVLPKRHELFGGLLIMIGILLIHWAKTKNIHNFLLRRSPKKT